ncbi:MAG: nucleoside triphosphate pyrophosphohydrolase [Planctomycetota bacterium]
MNDSTRLAQAVGDLSKVMQSLRRSCPWDRAQTHESLRRYLIEESHEVLEALDADDPEALKSELGDLLFQVWFHAEIASERDLLGFDLRDVLCGVRDKLIARHPHVFADESIETAAEVQKTWESRKLAEGRQSRLEGVPGTLPALLKAEVYQRKAASAGFDWPSADGAVEKIREEIEEWLEASRGQNVGASPAMVDEFGDLLFSLVNLARFQGINSEDALRGTCRKFKRRFQYIERKSNEAGAELESMTLEQMETLWVEAKGEDPPRS